MESDRIEIILEKYFHGETSIAEERELKNYFSSMDVAQHLEQYRTIFGYFSQAKEQQFAQEIPQQTKKRNVAWLSIAASVVVLLGIGTYAYFSRDNAIEKKDLGTYNDPEEAFRATQQALLLLSDNVKVGIESAQYIQEYQIAKDKIFVNPKKHSGGL
ncbi:hypothetical protein [Flavobacterium caseinilyticum]|uniref:Uncharacterized protein n=1 Tax=Flavobacterium caseinilyticum TaxID=2541732 RepID=A0A4R5AQB3_9FLAO|nr:hypothetical protein [Flavobacterium caseinilyticum]TDD75258.1 hypothetical protein E0F89_12835 [Flavobacterium caseinilyticum]